MCFIVIGRDMIAGKMSTRGRGTRAGVGVSVMAAVCYNMLLLNITIVVAHRFGLEQLNGNRNAALFTFNSHFNHIIIIY